MMSKIRKLLDLIGFRAGSKTETVSTADDDGSGFGVLEDMALSGWFIQESGELYRGFPISDQDVVLDVGCGDAPFIRFCADQGAEVAFADIDQAKVNATEQALQATAAKSINPIVSDCNPLPLPDGYATKVISLEVLEHVDCPKTVLDELVRIGKSGAQYLITVPGTNIENLQKNGLAPPVYFEKPNHIRVFSEDELKALVESAGLVVESQSQFGFYWSLWWVFFWACKQDLAPPWHPLLKAWTATWAELLSTEEGPRIKSKLDAFLPKTQLIIARKP